MTEGYADDLVVLSGFSGQYMGADDGGPRNIVAGQFIDAAAGTPEEEFEDTDDDDFEDAPVTSNISTGM